MRLAQDRLDAHSGVLEVGAGLAFKGQEAFEIEHVVRRTVVREVPELQRSEPHLPSDRVALLRGIVLRDMCLIESISRTVGDERYQISQPKHTALTGLERSAVLAVDSAKPDVLENRLIRGVARPSGCPEYLLEVE